MPHPPFSHPARRQVLAALAFAGLAPAAWAAAPAGGRLRFAVFRNGAKVGEQEMTFSGPPDAPSVVTAVDMRIRLGPVPVFRYRHEARERWTAGRFLSLETTTNSNGKREQVSARRTGAGLVVETAAGRQDMALAAPFTHWNAQALTGPLFNPQTGKLLKVTARRLGPGPAGPVHWAIRGEATIDDWYDEAGVWTALTGKLPDGSTMEYRRI